MKKKKSKSREVWYEGEDDGCCLDIGSPNAIQINSLELLMETYIYIYVCYDVVDKIHEQDEQRFGIVVTKFSVWLFLITGVEKGWNMLRQQLAKDIPKISIQHSNHINSNANKYVQFIYEYSYAMHSKDSDSLKFILPLEIWFWPNRVEEDKTKTIWIYCMETMIICPIESMIGLITSINCPPHATNHDLMYVVHIYIHNEIEQK